MSELLEKLSAPFAPATVSWRLGPTNTDKTRGMALAYIDARDVQDRLNEVCGTKWQTRHPWSSGTLIACEIGIHVDGEWIWRGDGAGEIENETSGTGERKEQAQDMARKAAFSDSFKRAAVRWGVGRYLYDIDSPWVEIEARGRSYFIPDRELARLRSLLMRPTPAATRDATSAGTSRGPLSLPRDEWERRSHIIPDEARGPSSTGERQPQSAGEERTLSQIRDSIHKELSLADSVLLVDDILRVSQAELALLKGASALTHSRLISYAGHRKAALAGLPQNGSALAGEVREALGQP
jgi:hypothetical protein